MTDTAEDQYGVFHPSADDPAATFCCELAATRGLAELHESLDNAAIVPFAGELVGALKPLAADLYIKPLNTAPAPADDDDPQRAELIALCRDGVVPHEKWSDRDTARAQQQLATAGALLAAGCNYTIDPPDQPDDDRTINLRIEYRGFSWFEGGFDHDCRDEYLDDDHFYIPTRKRLNDVDGGDWYC